MPQLKQLSCTIQWADTGAPFQEYGTVYGDGLVETFIVVPNKPQPFTIQLKSLSFIHEGLAVIVFIDGNYQANRNRVNLKPFKKNRPFNHTQVNFLLRQREKPIGDGIYMGREWRFDNHNIVEDLPEGVKESHFDLLGTIEVFILRCRARVPEEVEESGSSSAADSDVLGEKGQRVVIDEDEEKFSKPSDKDGPAEELRDILGGTYFGNDITKDHKHGYGLDGGSGRYHEYGIPPQWYPSDATHSRNHMLHQATDLPPLQNQPFQDFHGPAHQTQGPHVPKSQKHVRFDLGGQPPPPPISMPPRPPSYERTRQPMYTPAHQAYQPGFGALLQPAETTLSQEYIPSNPNLYNNMAIPRYQQQSHPMSSGQNFISQAAPVHTFGPPPPPPPLPTPLNLPYLTPQHFPMLPNSAFPYSGPSWSIQPPHLIYNPHQQIYGPGWPAQPDTNELKPPNLNPGPGNVTDPPKSSNNSWPSTQQGAQDGQNQNSTADVGGQAHGNAGDWEGWTTNTPADSTQDNTRASSGGQADNDGNNNWNQANNDDENNNVQSSSTNDDWTKNDNDNDNDNNSAMNGVNDDWNQESNANDNNAAPDDVEDAAVMARALFGPHGQYYTYNPRGPDDPTADAEEEPRYDVPKKVASATGSTKQVLPGSGYMYWKRRCAPQYVDTMEEPYARFVFKYRTKDQLETEIGIKIDVEPTGDEAVQELQAMDKQALVEMLMRAKSALGGKVPSPSLKPTALASGKSTPVAVEPPDHAFLKYKLPELRKTRASTTDGVTSTNENSNRGGSNNGRGGGGAAGSGVDDWNTGTNNNDSTWATNNSSAEGVGLKTNIDWGSTSKAKLTTDKDLVHWNRSWDGAAEQNMGMSNTTTNKRCSRPSKSQPQQEAPAQPQSKLFSQSLDQQPLPSSDLQDTIQQTSHADPVHAIGSDADWTRTANISSASSSPSTLLIDEPFNPAAHAMLPPPATGQYGAGFVGGWNGGVK